MSASPHKARVAPQWKLQSTMPDCSRACLEPMYGISRRSKIPLARHASTPIKDRQTALILLISSRANSPLAPRDCGNHSIIAAKRVWARRKRNKRCLIDKFLSVVAGSVTDCWEPVSDSLILRRVALLIYSTPAVGSEECSAPVLSHSER